MSDLATYLIAFFVGLGAGAIPGLIVLPFYVHRYREAGRRLAEARRRSQAAKDDLDAEVARLQRGINHR